MLNPMPGVVFERPLRAPLHPIWLWRALDRFANIFALEIVEAWPTDDPAKLTVRLQWRRFWDA